jgi:hypothetical protein
LLEGFLEKLSADGSETVAEPIAEKMLLGDCGGAATSGIS